LAGFNFHLVADMAAIAPMIDSGIFRGFQLFAERLHWAKCYSTLALALGCTIALGGASALAADADTPSVLVKVVKLEKGSLPKTVSGYGTVDADPSARTSLTAPLAAVVGQVFVRPGAEVAKGGSLVQLVPNPQTSASYAQALSALQNAKDLVSHTQQLYDQFLATKQDLANAQKAENDAQAALTAMKAQGAGGARIVEAPFDAIVTKLSIGVGAFVDVGTPLLDLAPPNSLVLRVGIVPDDAAVVNTGDPSSVTPVGGRKSIMGKVMHRGSMVEAANGLVPVDISLPTGALLPGQTASATITVGKIDGYVVPHEAILVDESGQPYVVQAVNMTAKIITVRVLGMDGSKNVIEGPLDASFPLVLAGNYQLQDGMKIRLSGPSEKQGP
jgi:RND family efflux transporter MFP subunit